MPDMTQRLLDDLRQVMTEIEAVVSETATHGGDGASAVRQRLQATLSRVRDRFGDLEKRIERDVREGARTAENYVRENAWASVAGAAVTGFILGVLLGRRV